MSVMQMSVSAAVLIVAIVAIRALALNKIPKTTFLVLWGIVLLRLLVPVSIPSPFDIYTAIQNAVKLVEPDVSNPAIDNIKAVAEAVNQPIDIPISADIITPKEKKPDASQDIAKEELTEIDEGVVPAEIEQEMDIKPKFVLTITPTTLIWITGMLAMTVFFTVIYFKNYRELRFVLPVSGNKLVEAFTAEHKTARHVAVMQSDRLATPVTTGITSPRIILPKIMNMSDPHLMRYVIAHEYCHIKRFDTLWKLLLICALCVHWVNPMVWVMFILANRDLELACDERVVRRFGAETKAAYAYSIISMAEQRKKFTPLYSGFSKNAAEERIKSIMKYKKSSIIAIILSVVMVIGTTTAFAFNAAVTDSPEADNPEEIIDLQGSDTEVQQAYGKPELEDYYSDANVRMAYEETKELYTAEKLTKELYDKAVLVEKSYKDISKVVLDIAKDNVTVSKGGDSVKIRYYTWADDEYTLSSDNGTLKLAQNFNKYLVTEENLRGVINKTNDWVSVLLRQLKRSPNPDNPTASNRTIEITVPEGVTLESLVVDTTSGGVTVSKCKINSIIADTTSGNITITDCNIPSIAVDSTSGAINITRCASPKIIADTTSGGVAITDCESSSVTADTTSGSVTVNGGTVNTISADTTSGNVKILNVSKMKTANLNTTSGNATVELNEAIGNDYGIVVSADTTAQVNINGTNYYKNGVDYLATNLYAPYKINYYTSSGKLTVNDGGLTKEIEVEYFGTENDNYNPNYKYTAEELAKYLYDEAVLVEKTYKDISKVKISTVTEDVVVSRGGDSVKIRYYEWKKGEHTLSDDGNGNLTLNYNKEFKMLYDRGNNSYSSVWVDTVVLNVLKRSPNPDDPEAVSRTIEITLPEGVELEMLDVYTVSGDITVKECRVASILTNTVNGASTIDGCVSKSVTQNTVNGHSVVKGGKVESVSSTSVNGYIEISGVAEMKNAVLSTVNGNAKMEILGKTDKYRIDYSGLQTKVTVNGKKYTQNSGTINKDALNIITFSTINGSFTVTEK